MFQPVDTKVSFPKLEESILELWHEKKIVEKSLKSGEKPFVFYEGPPTSNGQPGIHHVISRTFKDIILRYRSMQGYRIIGRREGWDTHGLPVEIEVEKALGFKGKPDIERYGIAEFNAKCRESVWHYIQDWKVFTKRIAFWLDEDAYVTYENKYIESLWWIFHQLWDQNLLFRDYKVTMHCPRCGTSLSDHEVSQGFRDDVDDPSVWVRFRVQGSNGNGRTNPLAGDLAGASFLAWTTTPWTLPANVALALNPTARYALAHKDGERLLMAEALVPTVLGDDATVERTYAGHELVGLYYDNLFDGVPGPGDTVDWQRAYHVITDEFVSLEDGTGVVHIAPAYGDLEIGRKYNLPTLFSVDLSGEVLPEFGELPFTGKFFKEADPDITRNLKERGLLFKSARVRHAYPFCWRCNTPLLYYAKRSWYIRTTEKKDELIANNQQINWVPEHIKEGRFGNWLVNNIDWAISRERYWGTPLPIWVSADGQHMECIGSLAELEEKVGRSLQDLDLHRPYVDEITWEDPQHGTMRRILDVADCWFDSGAMPIAQWHYPFEQRDIYNDAAQADYICEAVDQTRGWFYTLHAISTLLFDRPAYKNVICLGHILDGEGQKMSKSRGNVVVPQTIIEEQGVDALRWYLYTASPPGNPRRFSGALVNESLRKFMLTFWNSYAFFVTYANLDQWQPDTSTDNLRSLMQNPIDQWALARLNGLVRDVTEALESYEVTNAAREIELFVDELSNWYVRRNRRRFWKAESDTDKHAAYMTLYTCLVTVAKLAAPFIPFVSESMYGNLVLRVDPQAAESIHLAAWPKIDEALLDEKLVADTETLLKAVGLGRAARKSANIKIRQPLSELWVRASTPTATDGLRRFEAELRDELNVKTVRYLDSSTDLVEYRCKPNLRLVGRKYGKRVPALTAALRDLDSDAARVVARAAEGGEAATLTLDGEAIELLPDELLIETSSPEGYAVAEDNGTLVALNTTLSPELVTEGLARELIRNIQDARKNAGFDISDRISVYLHSQNGTGVTDVVQTWDDYIRAETLADELVLDAPPHNAHTESLALDEQNIIVGVVQR
ncbi:MAG: isoleucine--tRNA ligase [Chloroflexi bacterium AL-W]|nr:isoleucine--tRNA ligase [Chloroflexi bacterium AL-N1]NOK70335.1 isoleucine--tRNA ligase [Chloroflexi bacterium AL-N10]NOK78013.1 isoleucine--tRNA ligase [Chloroflexi bacterium AL-N5]NOK85112.1 isoleucine--tRNA ligase [Chloroflexi bacterium AL-W]NOK92101.1 isoleucine--tRNA ligase [Chloroflexi bacterium AL-N15]